MSVQADIENALLTRASGLSALGVPIAMPNNDFTPPESGSYIRVQHLPNANIRQFLDGTEPHWRQGILQITAISPLGQGPAIATALAAAIAAYFPADLALYEGAVKVTISRSPDIAPAINGDISWDVPVSIRYETSA